MKLRQIVLHTRSYILKTNNRITLGEEKRKTQFVSAQIQSYKKHIRTKQAIARTTYCSIVSYGLYTSSTTRSCTMQFMFNNQMYWCHTFLASDIQNILHSITAVQECTKTINTKQNTKKMPVE